MSTVMRKILACCVAVLALGAVAAASALAALPEFSTAGTFPVSATTTGEKGTLETLAGHQVNCTSQKSNAQINAKEGSVTSLIFNGCKSNATTEPKCESTATEGEITTNALKSKLVYINKANKEAGLLFEPEASGGLYSEFHCKTLIGNETVKVKGSIVAKITPVNTKTSKFTVVFSMPKKGMQLTFEPTEGVFKEDVMLTKGEGPENFGYEESGASGTAKLTTTEEVELKA